jgi:hypothetical protein
MNISLKNLGLLPIVGLLALGLLTACNPPAEQEQQSPVVAAEEAVMAQHDSLMARMDESMAYQGKLKKADPAASAPYLRGLQAADKAMMDWMYAYKATDTLSTAAQRLAYLQQQKQILDKVNEQQHNSLDSAQAFLGSH